MKVIKALPTVMYHCFKLLQIGIYVLLAIDIRDWWNFIILGFVVSALLLPTVAIYVASFRYSRELIWVWKVSHGFSVMLGYLSFAISVMMCFDLNFVGAYYMFLFGLGTVPVMVEGLVRYLLWRKHSATASDPMPVVG